MWAYTARKLMLTIPILFGIILFTFVLFTFVARDPARAYAGKIKSAAELEAIRAKMGLNKPIWLNRAKASQEHRAAALFDSQFFDVLLFRYPPSLRYQESVWTLFKRKAPVSLAIQLPVFIIEFGLQLALALYVASRRGSTQDLLATLLSVLGMSVPALSIYMGAQWLFGAYLRWFPVAGWDTGFFALHFMALPILVSVVVGVGGGVRFYRTVILEDIGADYVRTARAKGVSPREILLTHVLRNVMVTAVTQTVVALPLLFTGALLLERLFQIPGFGNLMVDAINNQDRPVVMAVVTVTAFIYCIALVVTDICYALVDPRVSLK